MALGKPQKGSKLQPFDKDSLEISFVEGWHPHTLWLFNIAMENGPFLGDL